MARIPAENMIFARPDDWTGQVASIFRLLIFWNVTMEEFAGQIGMCLVDADAIPTPGDVSVRRQNLSVLANRYFGEFRNRIPCIERNGNESLRGWSPTELQKKGCWESIGCRQGE
jgi:hypothetical protein